MPNQKRDVGSIEPKKPLAIIQSSSNNPVKINNLHENKPVTKGDLLVQYDNSDIKNNTQQNNSDIRSSDNPQAKKMVIFQNLISKIPRNKKHYKLKH